VGVPLMTPVLLLIDRPGGSEPLVENTLPPLLPVTVMVWL
jgi:hypothetical protein